MPFRRGFESSSCGGGGERLERVNQEDGEDGGSVEVEEGGEYGVGGIGEERNLSSPAGFVVWVKNLIQSGRSKLRKAPVRTKELEVKFECYGLTCLPQLTENQSLCNS